MRRFIDLRVDRPGPCQRDEPAQQFEIALLHRLGLSIADRRLAYHVEGERGRLLAECVTHLDREQAVGYLETDKEVNVAFYERFGFRVVERQVVIGVPNWFMLREPGAAPGRAGPSRR